ncbi:MAG: class I SAM-dependent methyltransferase [Oscillospiraceae bacterium]|nr:class I SAM-dependent methyltransferase [Oscillospiraceae bacterium]
MVRNQESYTAKLCAFARAWHSNTARQKIFDDYLAYDLIGWESYETVKKKIMTDYADGTRDGLTRFLNDYFAPIPLARLRFTESRLHRFAQSGKVQYVICGAGADSFSFRNANPDIEVFEVDHPDTQRYKRERIRELEWNIPKNVHFVPVDFEKETMTSGLLDAGFSTEKPSFFSILGVSYYLTLPVLTETLRQIAELASLGSVLVFDFPLKGEHFPPRVRELEQITESLGESMRGGFTYAEISRALYALGFQIDTYYPSEKVQEHYFANRADGMRAWENVSLLSATYTNGQSYE